MREQAQIIRWEEPPPARSGGGRPRRSSSRWDSVAEELRARPGQYAVVAEGPGRTLLDLAWRINRGLLLSFSPPGAYETTTRQGPRVNAVYARYVGDGHA